MNMYLYKLIVALIWGEALGHVVSGPLDAIGGWFHKRTTISMKELRDLVTRLEAAIETSKQVNPVIIDVDIEKEE